jgi:DMSO/TMAO reductase YedYZ molybdopterin-dependent catalytic subunit
MEFTRRSLITSAGASVATGALALGVANGVDLGLPGGPSFRPLGPRFPGKGEMIVQRVSPPLLETPFSVFDTGILTPNDQHFVRWHWMPPTIIDVASYRVTVRGAVRKPQNLSLNEIVRVGEHVEFAALNQCAGNGRGFFEPRVAGAQWANGAMSNAQWRGVRLRDILDRAAVVAAAKFVRFRGLDAPTMDGAPHYAKSIPIAMARHPDTIVAFAMNNEALPLLNGFPVRLIVPGWYSTYWVKMLSDIEVLTDEDDNFWMAKAYRMPVDPVKPGDKDFPTVPIAAMRPRSFVTSHADGATVPRGATISLRGIATGGDTGVTRVDVMSGSSIVAATLGPDAGEYGFRRWTATLPPQSGAFEVRVRCANEHGIAQPDIQSWNPSGYASNAVERITLDTV